MHWTSRTRSTSPSESVPLDPEDNVRVRRSSGSVVRRGLGVWGCVGVVSPLPTPAWLSSEAPFAGVWFASSRCSSFFFFSSSWRGGTVAGEASDAGCPPITGPYKLSTHTASHGRIGWKILAVLFLVVVVVLPATSGGRRGLIIGIREGGVVGGGSV